MVKEPPRSCVSQETTQGTYTWTSDETTHHCKEQGTLVVLDTNKTLRKPVIPDARRSKSARVRSCAQTLPKRVSRTLVREREADSDDSNRKCARASDDDSVANVPSVPPLPTIEQRRQEHACMHLPKVPRRERIVQQRAAREHHAEQRKNAPDDDADWNGDMSWTASRACACNIAIKHAL